MIPMCLCNFDDFSGEEEDHAEDEASWPRERHHRQLRAHLQARGVQDQEDRGSGSVKDSLKLFILK